MKPAEALAKRIIEGVEVGGRMIYREDQSVRTHDFDLRGDNSGDHNDTDHFFTHTGLLNVMLEKEFGVGFHSIIFDKVEAELQGSEQARTAARLSKQ